MTVKRTKELMMISLDKAIELYLSTMETEGKSPRYIDWLRTRLKYYSQYIQRTYKEEYKIQDLAVEDGRGFIRYMMERDKKYPKHPMMKETPGKLKIQYIHGCARSVRSLSTWAYEEGYLDENIMRRLKLPSCPRPSRNP
jgi:site-specific recombinase XerD